MEPIKTLGKLLKGDEQRDAIHIAIAPVKAAEKLNPGQPVSRIGVEAWATSGEPIGVVDPFLKSTVKVGQWFWMFLYPNTITSLRHEWAHPAFSNEAPVDPKIASEAWLRAFVASSDCPGYEEVIAKAVDNRNTWDEDYLHFDGIDANGSIPPEIWYHIEIVTGRKITHMALWFSCAC